jgi:hypothetical protein
VQKNSGLEKIWWHAMWGRSTLRPHGVKFNGPDEFA